MRARVPMRAYVPAYHLLCYVRIHQDCSPRGVVAQNDPNGRSIQSVAMCSAPSLHSY